MKTLKPTLFALVCAGFLFALSGGPTELTAQSKGTSKQRLPNYWRQIGLSKEQVQDVYRIQGEYEGKIKALEQQLRKLEAEEKAKLVEILSPTQKEKLRQIYLEKTGIDLFSKEKEIKKSPKGK